MRKIYKEVLAPGTYLPPDGRVIKVKPEDIKRIHSDFQQQLAENHAVGFVYEHPDDELGLPATTPEEKAALSDYAFYGGGLIDETLISKSGKLVVGINMEDDKQAERLLKSKARVSPQYGPLDLTSKGGSKFGMALHHVCLTHKPVQRKQESFTDKPVLSLSEATNETSGWFVRLSEYDYFDEAEENSETPVVALAEVPDKASTPKKKKSPKDNSKDPKSQEKSSKKESGSFSDEKPDPLSDEQADNEAEVQNQDLLTQKAEAGVELSLQEEERVLQGWGLLLNSDSVLKNKPEILRSVMAAINEAFADQSFQIPVKSVIPMSEAKAPEVNPEVVRLSEELTKLSERAVICDATIKHLVSKLEDNSRKGYVARIDECVRTGRCNSDKAAALKALAESFQFSLEGTKGELDWRLAEIESLPAESVVRLSNDSQRYEQAQVTAPAAGAAPTPISGVRSNCSQDQIDQYLKEIYGYGPINQSVGFN